MYVRLIARSDRGGIINNCDAVMDRFEPLRRLERRDEADVGRKTLPFVREINKVVGDYCNTG